MPRSTFTESIAPINQRQLEHAFAGTHRFRHELAVRDFGARNIYAGDLYRGFIYFQRQPYSSLRVKIVNVSERKTEILELPAR